MAVFIVVWNLNKEGAGYDTARGNLFELLHKTDHSYSSNLETTAFISTSSSANQLYEYFGQALDKSDRIFISLLTDGKYKGWLDKTQAEWVDARS